MPMAESKRKEDIAKRNVPWKEKKPKEEGRENHKQKSEEILRER